MPKLKTHSGAKKRFNLTKSGKVKRARAYKPRAGLNLMVIIVYNLYQDY